MTDKGDGPRRGRKADRATAKGAGGGLDGEATADMAAEAADFGVLPRDHVGQVVHYALQMRHPFLECLQLVHAAPFR